MWSWRLKADEYGKLQLVEETPGQEEEGVKVIKEKGEDPDDDGEQEAVASGLEHAGIVRGTEDIRAGLGIASWHKVAEGAAAYVQNHLRRRESADGEADVGGGGSAAAG